MTGAMITGKSLPEILRSMGKTEKAGGNKPFLLTGTGNAWFILHGNVDVFSVGMVQGKPSGGRSYYFSAGTGELLFGTGDVAQDRNLIAVPSPDTEIIHSGMDHLRTLLADPLFKDEITVLLDHWITHLSQGISKDINPRTDRVIGAGEGSRLDANLKIRSKKGIVWVEFLQGNALFLGMKEIAEPGSRTVFPVSQDSWLQTTAASEIRSFTTAELLIREDAWQQLENLYGIILFCDFFNTRLNSVDDFNRLREKAGHSTRVRSSTLLKIAAVINDGLRKTYIDTGQDPLLTACSLVAGYNRIPVAVPKQPKSEEARPLTLNDILRASRFRARKVRLSGAWWKKEHGALLAFTKEGNLPVALVPKSSGKYEYISPGSNLRQSLSEKNAPGLVTEAWQFYRPFPDEPVRGFQLLKFGISSSFGDIFLVILAGLTGGILTLLVPVLTGNIFDWVIPKSDYRQLYVYGMVIFFSILAVSFFQLLRSFAMIRIETRLDFSLQSAIWDRLLNLPVPFFRKYTAGELAAKANSVMMLRKILSDTVIYTLLGSIFMLFNFFLLFFYSVFLGILIFLILLISLSMIWYLGIKIRRRQRIIIQLQNRIYGLLIQFLSSISKIRIAGAEVHAFSQWASKFSANKRETYEVRKLYLANTVLATLLPLLIILIVFAVIASQPPGAMSTGKFMAFYTAMTMTVVSFLQLGMAAIAFFMAIPLLENIRPILETLPENISLKPEIRDLTGEIEVANVSFRYQADGPLVLDNLSVHIQPGEFVAIVGSSGSGKSTLLRLLLGFESPESGSVYYDRQDISSFDPSSVRRQAGTVLQQSQLSTGTILSNITGMTPATFEDAWEAAKNVGMDEDIREMPMGMHTVITGGLSTLSGGQRQRIMIARAIVNKPRILFFDEATSALDNKTQHIVSESLEKLQSTRVVIAHRLTTVQHADRIYLMDQGKIAESGTYEELIALDGKFAALVRRQMVE
ncbi:MAG: NHLP bacteriocin export ABC transporter permease/ATPase subunit [bacterium]